MISDLRRGLAWAVLPVSLAIAVRLTLEPAYLTRQFAVLIFLLALFALAQAWLTRQASAARIRTSLLVNYVAITAGYLSIGLAMNSHAGWRADDVVYAAERMVFAGDPQRFLPAISSPWMSTVVMIGYLGFFGFLLYLFLSEAFRVGPATGRVQLGLMRLYGLGFAGYLLLPAAGPAFHHPSLLPAIPHSAFTAVLQPWVLSNCSRVDVCPSIHAAVCTFTLGWVFRRRRNLFLLLLPVGAALLLGTVYLHYHYFLDVVFGVALGLAVTPSLSHELRTPVLEPSLAAR